MGFGTVLVSSGCVGVCEEMRLSRICLSFANCFTACIHHIEDDCKSQRSSGDNQ